MKLSRSKTFLLVSIVFVAGIAVASFLPENLVEYRFFLFFGVIIFSILLVLFFDNKKALFIIFVLLSFVLALWRYAICLPADSSNKIWHYNGREVTFVGLVDNEPEIKQENQRLEINVTRIKKGAKSYEVEGRVLVTTNLYPQYKYGDLVKIYGELRKPESFNEFAYDRYLARFNIHSVCYYPKISILESGQGNFLYSNIFYFKDKIRDVILRNLPEPEASLASAVVLGDKKLISEDWRTIFAKSGISHITAISGMHISILTAMIISFFLGIGLNRKYAFYLSLCILFFYILLIGLPASAMRAGLMGFLVLWALNIGRLSSLTNSLVFAAVILLFINPLLLRDDVGFQLSFLAILGIVYVYPTIERLCDNFLRKISLSLVKSKLFEGIKSIFLITISVQIFTLPILAYNFSMISLIAPAANIFVLWCLPFAIFFTLGASFFSYLLPDLGVLFFTPAYFIFKYVLSVSEYFSNLPLSFLLVENVWPGWIILYCLVVFIFLNFKKIQKKLQ